MSEEKGNSQLLTKAAVFFERAKRIGQTGNFDYAIDMYLEGLHCAADELEQGHIPLHNLGLLRQSKGGKKPSMIEKAKRLRGKTALDQLINAEFLFAKDPEHLPYAEAMLKAGLAGDYKKTAKWIADLIFGANNAAEKPSLQTYLLLKDSYAAIDQYDRALAACQHAVKLKPKDAELADEFQRLSAELTVAKGKYNQEGDFRKAIKNREDQEKLQAQDSVVKTENYRLLAVGEARRALAQDPNLSKNIINMAKALSELQDDKSEDEAIKLLESAYESKKDFSFKQQAGQIKIKQLKRKIRGVQTTLKANPADAQAKSMVSELVKQLNSLELVHYQLCVANYPTDLRAKYDYGVRLIRDEKYDEAIPLLQDAQRDPHHKISSMSKIGLCFYMKGWYVDAIDIFNQAIEAYEIKDNAIGKELRYNLGRSFEDNGDRGKALEIYRRIAQLDFGYKDVRKRVDKLRSQGKE